MKKKYLIYTTSLVVPALFVGLIYYTSQEDICDKFNADLRASMNSKNTLTFEDVEQLKRNPIISTF